MTTSVLETGTDMLELFRKMILAIDKMMLTSGGLAKVCLALSAGAWLVITIIQVMKAI